MRTLGDLRRIDEAFHFGKETAEPVCAGGIRRDGGERRIEPRQLGTQPGGNPVRRRRVWPFGSTVHPTVYGPV